MVDTHPKVLTRPFLIPDHASFSIHMPAEMVPLTEAENEVKVVTKRLALLHLAYARTLVDEFGWERGKQLVLDSIRRYGVYVADQMAKGEQSLPKYGFWERREGKPNLCELGKVMIEMGETELGSLYCLIDPAKTMAGDPSRKMIHTRCMILGHDECRFETVPTTPEDKRDFEDGRDWAHADPLIGDYVRVRPGPDSAR